jgi:hypothetical protein
MNLLAKTIFMLLIVSPSALPAQVSVDTTTNPQKGNINQDVVNSKKDDLSIWNNITFLNAANFDFSPTVTGSYLGKLNILSPDIKNTPFGFNAGIMRVKFNYKDSSNVTFYTENKLIHPLDSIKQGGKYLREFNQYTTTRSNIVWSFYAQPMLRLFSWPFGKGKTKDGNFALNSGYPNGIYLHFHLELLVNKANVTTSIQNLQRDTSTIDTSKHLSYLVYERNPLIFDKTFLNGYYGFGLTINVDPFGNGNSRFFFQPTIGKTTNYPNWTSEDISANTVNIVPTRSGTGIQSSGRGFDQTYEPIPSSWFYLIRAEFTQMLSNNSQIIVGSDIRGLFPKYDPLYSAYIGLNVNLNALVSIISDKDKDKDKGNK